jgi:rhamnopyranosyl-N-acetylglucosaminyl-diphospho-decaprenol beta-1,3/1,4-galactofuranosyltransferase
LEPKKILVVVVTYNRCELLKRCLDHIEAQSRQTDAIVVINNGSTDNTEAMLSARGIRCITQENLGSAGGWNRGIECALNESFDAVWLMDDDGYPEQDALSHLEKALKPGLACVSSVVLCEDDPERLVFPFPILNKNELPVLFSKRRNIKTLPQVLSFTKKDVFPFAHFFNGTLVAMDAIRRIGNVNRDFFMSGDELDYFYRLREYGAIYSVLAAHHYHPDVGNRPLTRIKVYYYIKNTLILNGLYFDQVFVRNILCILATLARVVARNGLLEAMSYIAGKNAPVFYRSIARGMLKKLGKDLDD